MTTRPEKGDPAPLITLPASGDSSISLGKPDGGGQILFFYPKDNTPGCTTEARDFSEKESAFRDLGYQIVGISRDSLKSHENFIGKQDLKVILASDEDGTACKAYGVWVEKKLYGRTYMGIERSTFAVNREGQIIAVWRKVRVKGHAEMVLAQITGSPQGTENPRLV
jgi:peroxiredoxin Q/BCP